ncbi:MAG: DUF1232 domain-containing protein [Anaerolineae bacterium]|nr:DUF1232 domain-containing protein [Anaerolineae bacterium]
MNQPIAPRPDPAPQRNITLPQDPTERVNLLRSVYERAILSWKLMWDERVSLWAKLLPIGAITYLFVPIDVIPEALLAFLGPGVIVGGIDDVAILLLAFNFFIELAPRDVVVEHLREMGARITGQFSEPSYSDEDVIEGEAEPLDDEPPR